MIHYYQGETPADVYRWQLRDLVEAPDFKPVVQGGRKTHELLNVITEITQPRNRMQIVPGRRLNPWLALSESLWMLAGRDDVAVLKPYNKRICSFSDDGVKLYGAYGKRLMNQLPAAIERLKADDTDRRAVLSIWEPRDLMAQTLDPPCNTQVRFKVRENKLYMKVSCRSNDLHWGLHAVNLPQFSMLQEYVAARLGVNMGTQIHESDSLHIYTEGPAAEITYRMMIKQDEPIRHLTAGCAFPNPLPLNHEEFVEGCNAVLDQTTSRGYWQLLFFPFAHDFLRAYQDRIHWGYLKNNLEQFSDWIAVAEEFWAYEKTRA